MCFPFLLAAQDPPQKAPEPVRTSITVTEKIAAETPADVSVFTSRKLAETPGYNLDDRLRSLPGFSLFRRSSSLVAHPTTQGISLRGIGSSGASRTLVLWDGVPANDPFGGWVYWTQFIPEEISRVEISRGAATSIFGDRAMTGAIGIFTRQPERLHLFGGFVAGNRNTEDATLGFSNLWGAAAISGAARAFHTDGYYIVPEANRGSVDRFAGVQFVTGDVHVDHYTSLGNLYLRVNILAEDRQNGTSLTHNSTSMGTVALHYERQWRDDSLSVMGFHTREGFHSSFSSVSADRNRETLSYLQTVPSNGLGGAALWQHHRSRFNLTGGADVNRVEGTSTDHLVSSALRIGGGTQLQHGVFAQADANFGPARLFGGLRYSLTSQSSSVPSLAAGLDTHFVSPSAGFVLGRRKLRARGSVYRGFRAPTLNELFREFRVGNTATLANPALRPETVFGSEAGVDWVGESSTFRVTAYRNSLGGLITNVTLSSSANAIVRQRANAADAVSRGFEAEFVHRYRDLTADFEYLFVESRYVTGLWVAQVPKHQGSGSLSYLHGGTMASVMLRGTSYQFDDDLNTLRFRLGGYVVLEMIARQHLVKSLSAEAAVDNALDRTFFTAFTPTPNIGNPRLWRIGLRWDGSLR
jgi:outer membrane receptor protein involved in Fe transport